MTNHRSNSVASKTGPSRRRPGRVAVSAALAGGLFLAACGSSGSTATPSTASSTTAAAAAGASTTAAAAGASTTAAGAGATTAGGPVLPVTANPITNSATAMTLSIDSVLVENNVDGSGKTTSDHLEIALTNSGTTDLTGFEVFYTFTDPSTATTESYYAKLPDTFSIPAGGSRVAHFDDSGAVDHFPVNKYSLYYTDTNALDVTVMVSAKGAAPQTLTIKKDAGGPETAD
jgi:hypothetical protein